MGQHYWRIQELPSQEDDFRWCRVKAENARRAEKVYKNFAIGIAVEIHIERMINDRELNGGTWDRLSHAAK